jgi:ribosome-associated toxin RatA of RatAB toxin-antitoxin module
MIAPSPPPTPPTPPPAATPKKRRLRLLFIPAVLLALALLAFLVFYVRGTWAATEPRNPGSVGEGPVSQLYQTPDGHKVVRCAILLPYSVERVWAVVTDYAHYSDFLQYLSDIQTTKDGDAWKMTGQADSALSGTWAFNITVHDDKPPLPKPWHVWWDENPGQGDLELNRGSWELTPAADNQTLLVLSLEAEVAGTQTFFLRNFFLHRLKVVVRAVEKRLQTEAAR